MGAYNPVKVEEWDRNPYGSLMEEFYHKKPVDLLKVTATSPRNILEEELEYWEGQHGIAMQIGDRAGARDIYDVLILLNRWME